MSIEITGIPLTEVPSRSSSLHSLAFHRDPHFPSTPFVLRKITDFHLQLLCKALWDWNICTPCLDSENYKPFEAPCFCPWHERSERLVPFFCWYKEVSSSYAPDTFGDDCQALRDHKDLCDVILALRGKKRPEEARCFDGAGDNVPQSDKLRAVKLAWRVMTMCNADFGVQGPGTLEQELHLMETWMDSFPSRRHPSLEEGETRERARIVVGLSADQLVGVGGLKLRGTDELQNHLKLDQENGEVLVFGWTAVLKEGLLATLQSTSSSSGRNMGVAPKSELFGRVGECIPRALALETLHTLALLFPPSNSAAQKVLRSLLQRKTLPDGDILRFGTSSYERSASERNLALQFPIWGSRLLDLYDEVENPRPRGRMESWLERRSKSRHVMMATIAGVGAAVILGILGLGVAMFQTWISWQQYKLESAKANMGGN
ncbi:hypothetical protein QBC43DRAFT_371149 [Cladorrhinum sp. PSN259]|nr:hypothetical protein QBC43DRAFT_371149 [Cladorrhinum sp. PSN259]